MKEPILQARDLHKTFGDVKAVQGISFQIARGEIYSLLGPNGAGKTTTISMLTGLIRPTRGDALIGGYSITRDVQRVKEIIGVVPQEIALYPSLTARENLRFWGKMYGLSGKKLGEQVTAALELAGLQNRADDKVQNFSGGMKRRLNIAVGLLHEPQILFMDEPTVGIDPQSRRRILDTVKMLNEQGMTVLYTTHYMEEAEELSHRIGIIDHGRLIAEGTLAELTQLVGQMETMRLSVEAGTKDLTEVMAILHQIPELHNIFSENGHLIIQAQDANAALPVVISQLGQTRVAIKSLSIQEPDLEAVFLHLTGRALRD
ncbi:MAG: ABC transporter ATP-binding protein [Chloroflexi bacterium]|nr:MAG: ABC transporter ATP-binding protein [Chloroflexota bacterium]